MTTAEATTGTSYSPLHAAGRLDPRTAGAYLSELFAAHGQMIVGLCRLLLRNASDAEDATQQVFLSAHRSLLAGAVPRDPRAWLAAIARNECRARIRQRMREPLALPDVPDDLPDPLATAIRDADLTALWDALSELPRRQRRAFLLRELGGLSYGELGAALGVTRPAVESLLFRARRQLRRAVTGANAALVPVALRDQIAQLIPGFGAASATSVPVAAKVAAVTVGVGLGVAGVATLPHAHRTATHTPRAGHAVPAPATRAEVAAPMHSPLGPLAGATEAHRIGVSHTETEQRAREGEHAAAEPEKDERAQPERTEPESNAPQAGSEKQPQPEQAAPQERSEQGDGGGSGDSGSSSSNSGDSSSASDGGSNGGSSSDG